MLTVICRFWGSLVLFCTVFVIGCGSSNPTAPVSGTVRIDGKPAPGIIVQFEPTRQVTPGKVGYGAAGVTDAQGHYELLLADPSKNVKGATLGVNSVTLRTKPGEETVPGIPNPVRSTLPNGVEAVTTTFEVPRGGTKNADFDLPLK